ncbi:50S ribosomal protein L32 [Actinomyces qiguomingii]|uniref:50S ribosomal protein L32 n=1 Tax=Actinomyces qiguomingii TaxID=2057800 RepID=UPI000CA08BA0|nr:50S ribosomal protein L32 [Actinomyces qiguomingii]
MAVPKRKMSRSNTRNRRSQWKAKMPALQTITVAGRKITVPARLSKAYRTGLLEG